jgi:hypothetical protein
LGTADDGVQAGDVGEELFAQGRKAIDQHRGTLALFERRLDARAQDVFGAAGLRTCGAQPLAQVAEHAGFAAGISVGLVGNDAQRLAVTDERADGRKVCVLTTLFVVDNDGEFLGGARQLHVFASGHGEQDGAEHAGV